MLSLKTRDGTMLNVKVDDKARVAALVKASLADIKTDSFIGIAGMPQPDGSIQAFSIHIFLPAQRGVVPDRHGPWDARPGSTMTNAYVENVGRQQGRRDADGEIQGRREENRRHAGDGDRRGGAGQEGRAQGRRQRSSSWRPDKQADGSVLAKVMYVGRNVAPAM